MAVVVFDNTGDKRYETGVDHGVLYPLNVESAAYDTGFAWNGLTAVNEKPGGAAANPQYADNIKYLNLLSAETFAGTIEAFTYPDEFGACDGTDTPFEGVQVGQQNRATFGLSYRTRVGNDVSASLGYKLHLVYGALASPSEKDFATINDSPAAVQFSWDFDCTPVNVTDLLPTCLIVIDSTKVDGTALSNLEDFLYGTSGSDPSLPSPDDVVALFSGTVTAITLTAATFDGAHTITIPTQAGTTYYLDGVEHSAGTVVLTSGQKKVVSATPNLGYVFNKPFVESWLFTYVS
jgi:hypothetical protein